jgi:hypothetical protein
MAVAALMILAGGCATAAARSRGDVGGGSGAMAQLADAVVSTSPQRDSGGPKPDPGAKYLFYDILEGEQFNKQRKGFMYAYSIARSLGRRLVLHRLRVRKPSRPGVGRKLIYTQQYYTHEFYPFRKFFNMSHMRGDVPVHEFDELLHSLHAMDTSGSSKQDLAAATGAELSEIQLAFSFDVVLYMSKLLEGVDMDKPHIDDVPCPAVGADGAFGSSPFQWSKQPPPPAAVGGGVGAAAAAAAAPWVGQLYDISGLRAHTLRCVEIYGSLVQALRPYSSKRSIVLLNAHFQMGYGYHESRTRYKDRHYWGVREHLVFRDSLVAQARKFVAKHFGGESFLGVHWRRGDFVFARRPDVVKGHDEVAPRIKKLMAKHKLTKVFLATNPDTTKSDLEGLEKVLGLGKGGIVRFTPPLKKNGKPRKMAPPTQAVLDQLICAEAKVFIGTKTSMFTATIMEEREMAGKPFASTNNMFGDGQ